MMVRLRLLDIRCVKQQEMGGDEPYLLIRKNKVWSHDNMKSGVSMSLRAIQPISFTDEIELTLMEHERIGRDDVLGSGTITADQLNKGEQEFEFRDKGAFYQLVYEVLPPIAAAGASAPAPAAQPTPQPTPAPAQSGGGFGQSQGGGGFGQSQPQGGGFGQPQGGGGFGQPQGGGFGQSQGGGGFGQSQGGGFGQPQGFGQGGGIPQQGGFGQGGGIPAALGGGGVPLFAGSLDPSMSISLWLALAFLVLATADGQVSEGELQAYQRAIRTNNLPDPTSRFTWPQMIAMMNDGTLPNLSSYVANTFSQQQRGQLIPIMVQIIAADGQAGPGELAKLQQVAAWIGAPVSISYS